MRRLNFMETPSQRLRDATFRPLVRLYHDFAEYRRRPGLDAGVADRFRRAHAESNQQISEAFFGGRAVFAERLIESPQVEDEDAVGLACERLLKEIREFDAPFADQARIHLARWT
jgi:hypothetical protein